MSDQITLDPNNFSEQTLQEAAHGRSATIKPQLAVVLLKAKLGAASEPHLATLASDEQVDPRVRQQAIRELSEFPGAKALLKKLSGSSNPLVSQSASQALQGHNR
ncbi:MAG: hypothetical protein OJF51_001224 [Nitrospira sp.]|nr:MAG: hypothetical protein OJF51_001224 [Nitrospira sp.]